MKQAPSRRGSWRSRVKVVDCSCRPFARRGLVSGGFELSLAGFFDGLHKLGPKWIVMTDGKDGAYVSTPTNIEHCPAPQTTVIGTAGAGDAFSATFAAYIAQSVSAETRSSRPLPTQPPSSGTSTRKQACCDARTWMRAWPRFAIR